MDETLTYQDMLQCYKDIEDNAVMMTHLELSEQGIEYWNEWAECYALWQGRKGFE